MNIMNQNTQEFSIKKIRTLGPTGTNCEAAARHWSTQHGLDTDVELHDTLETAMELTLTEEGTALLGCVVYPDLHQLVFPHLSQMKLADVFLFDTFNMVLATRQGNQDFQMVATHPAPQSLVNSDYPIKLVSSNSEAAKICASGQADACITTLPAAKAQGLEIVRNFGTVPMGFTIHVRKD
ncbi:MAG: prephenate dehydratase [Pseudoruegeria sp.]